MVAGRWKNGDEKDATIDLNGKGLLVNSKDPQKLHTSYVLISTCFVNEIYTELIRALHWTDRCIRNHLLWKHFGKEHTFESLQM